MMIVIVLIKAIALIPCLHMSSILLISTTKEMHVVVCCVWECKACDERNDVNVTQNGDDAMQL